MTALGIIITSANALIMAILFLDCRRTRLQWYGWAGLALLVVAEWLMFWGVWPLNFYFTPIAWTAYILVVDAMVLAITGRSRLHNQAWEFLGISLLSIAQWLIFEAYNLRLVNWTYVGVPKTWAGVVFGFGWSFATITPAIFETGDLVEAFGWFRPGRGVRFSAAAEAIMALCGAVCVLLPVVIPRSTAAYLFALVWVGVVFLLDPMNHHLGWTSLLGDIAKGERSRFYSLLIAGWICGWFWEFWNYWAAAKWHYIFPIMQRYKIFEMPVAGYLGFLPFALDCFAMYSSAASIFSRTLGVQMSRR
jgi:hypothetical protein